MKKFIGFVVVFAILVSAVPANAQGLGYIPQTWDGWYYKWQGNQAMMLTADNLGMVRGLTNQLRRSDFRSLADDIRWNGQYRAYGLYGPRGFYRMYDQNRKPLSRKAAMIVGGVVGGALGAGVGYLASGSGRGSLVGMGIGAGIGTLAGLITHRGNRNNKDVVVTPPEPEEEQLQQYPPQQQVTRSGIDGIPIAVGTRPGMDPRVASSFWGPGATSSGRPNCMEQGMITLDNQSAGPLRVFKDGQPFEVLMPKEQKCGPGDGNYTGEIVGTIVSSDGLTGKVGAAPAKPQSMPGLVLVWR